MSDTLPQIRKEMEFNDGLHDLLGALKTIAVTQYRVLERKLKSAKPFYDLLQVFFDGLHLGNMDHPFFRPVSKHVCMIAVTSDLGLAGGLNAQVINAALSGSQGRPQRFVVIGERGQTNLRGRDIPFTGFEGIQDERKHSLATRLRDHVLGEVLKGNVGPVKLVYPRPVSFTVQRVEVLDLIPFDLLRLKDPQGEGKPAMTGSTPEAGQAQPQKALKDIIWESRPAKLAEYLVSLSMAQTFYDLFGLSRLSELAARFTHLEDSSRKIEEEQEKVKLHYFRVRHELVDRSMRDLFAARKLRKETA